MDFAAARKIMVDSQVRPHDVPNLALQGAMEAVPREKFVPENRRNLAYVEKEIPLFEGRSLLQARDFAKLVHAAAIKPTDLVLDLACGYGYSTAVLAQIAQMVVAVEEKPEIVARAERVLAELAIDNAVVIEAALNKGVPAQGPFDVIVINGAIEQEPEALLAQLKPSGRLVCFRVENGFGQALVYTKTPTAIGKRVAFEGAPLTILPGFKNSEGFVF